MLISALNIFLALILVVMITSSPQFVKCSSPLKDAIVNGSDIPELELKGTNFVIMRKRVTQAEGLRICESGGGEYDRLAVFPSKWVAVTVSKMIKNLSEPYTPEYDKKHNAYEWGLERRYWIGLVDFFEEGEWEWVKSFGLRLNYNFWFPGQPDHKPKSNKPEHCATLWNPLYYNNDIHTFNDESCKNKYYFICERKVTRPPESLFSHLKIEIDNT